MPLSVPTPQRRTPPDAGSLCVSVSRRIGVNFVHGNFVPLEIGADTAGHAAPAAARMT